MANTFVLSFFPVLMVIAVIAMGTSLHPIVCRQDRAASMSGHARLV